MSKLYFRYAAMNAGKSTALLQVAHNYEERGLRVLLFTAAHDDRVGSGRVGSRLGLVRNASSFGLDTDFVHAHLLALAGGALACLLIDEAQFLNPKQVRQLHRLAHGHKLPVICWGLRSDFRGDAFAGAATLLTRGEQSDLLARDTALEMTRRGPHARLVEFAGVGHAPTFVADDQVDVVADFLLG